MPGLGTIAPYDSLAEITQQVRTLLGDFIQNLNPNLAGTVNVNGTVVTLIAGSPFSFLLTSQTITINNVQYPVLSVPSFTQLILGASAGVLTGVSYSAIISLGDLFADAQPYVVDVINMAWRKVQQKLADKGHPRLESEVDLFSLPVVTNLDPISQQYVNWTQFFDGTNFVAANKNPPLLPQDFISPLRLWERQSAPVGTVNLNTLLPMHPAPDALWSRIKGSRNRYWDWRNDAIYFPGSILNMDLRVRYAAFLADLVTAGQAFSSIPVPIMRCGDSLAAYAAAIFVGPRGGENLVPLYEAKGDEGLDQITSSFSKLQQRASYSRIGWGSRYRRTRRRA